MKAISMRSPEREKTWVQQRSCAAGCNTSTDATPAATADKEAEAAAKARAMQRYAHRGNFFAGPHSIFLPFE